MNKVYVLGGLALIGAGVGFWIYQKKKAAAPLSPDMTALRDNAGSSAGTDPAAMVELVSSVPAVTAVANSPVATPLAYGALGGAPVGDNVT